jgi:nitrogenase-stabilizing/protective protein
MNDLIQRLSQLSAAEEFLNFFGVPYEQSVVNVNRLHILKRFQQYVRKEKGLAELDEVQMFTRYRELLTKAYDDFVHSNAQQEKVFKVFQEAGGHQHVTIESLKASLPDKRPTPPRAVENA